MQRKGPAIRVVAQAELRARAERRLAVGGERRPQAPRVVRELEVHKVELELQNEELKKAEDDAASALKQYRALFERAPIAYVIVESLGVVREANHQAGRLLGVEREGLAGKRLGVFVEPGLRPAFNAFLEEALALDEDSATVECEVRLDRAGRDAADVHLSGSRLSAADRCALVAIQDITERKRAETQLMVSRLTTAVENSQDAVALFDASDMLVACNASYRRLVGGAMDGSPVGRSLSEILRAWVPHVALDGDDARRSFQDERISAVREPSSTRAVRLLDGRALRITDSRTADGGWIETIWDITDDELRAEELQQARVMAESASAAKSEFLSSMSHELRTPLNAILGFAQLLSRDKKEPLSARHRERVDRILDGGRHLLRLIDDILDLSRIEAGGVSLSVEPMNVGEVLEEVRTTLEPSAARHGVRLAVQPVPLAVPPVSADRTRLLQVLMNFGSNAIKYNRPGGEATFRASFQRTGFVRVLVEDTGIGIPTEKQGKLFQPFQRAGQETGPIEGTGIGLVITQRLARLMGGDVGFRSVPAEGSAFWVDVPADQPRSRPTPTPPVGTVEEPRLSSQRRRLVLYVEDNLANVTFMADLVGTLDGFELITAPTAEAGIELARQRRPDLILMDVNLPKMSGIEALGQLRSVPETGHIPVVALTATAAKGDRERGLQSGFFRYLTKPVKIDDVLFVLKSLFDEANPAPWPEDRDQA